MWSVCRKLDILNVQDILEKIFKRMLGDMSERHAEILFCPEGYILKNIWNRHIMIWIINIYIFLDLYWNLDIFRFNKYITIYLIY